MCYLYLSVVIFQVGFISIFFWKFLGSCVFFNYIFYYQLQMDLLCIFANSTHFNALRRVPVVWTFVGCDISPSAVIKAMVGIATAWNVDYDDVKSKKVAAGGRNKIASCASVIRKHCDIHIRGHHLGPAVIVVTIPVVFPRMAPSSSTFSNRYDKPVKS